MFQVPNRVIGIPASKYETNFGATLNYLEFMRQFGIPRIIMPDEEFVEVDLLVLPGGMDINPTSYGEVPAFKTGHTDVFKQFFFDKRLKNYVDNGTPIFGICLGAQQLAAYFNCKLTQHLKWHRQSPAREAKAHEVWVRDRTPRGIEIWQPKIEEKNGKKRELNYFDVNSHHHQALLEEDMSDELELLAYAFCEDWNEKTIVESFIHRNLPIAGVQWHPEEWYDTFSYNLITKILLNE